MEEDDQTTRRARTQTIAVDYGESQRLQAQIGNQREPITIKGQPETKKWWIQEVVRSAGTQVLGGLRCEVTALLHVDPIARHRQDEDTRRDTERPLSRMASAFKREDRSMECRFCKNAMRGVDCFDTSSGESSEGYSIAWNLYCCDDCGAIARENVREFPGVVWIRADNRMEFDAAKSVSPA